MTRGVSWFLVAPLVLLGLSACKFSPFEQREPWRAEAEEQCLAGGSVKSSAYTTPIREIEGAGTCGMEHPFKVSGLADGSVEVSPKATLACPMTASVDRWLVDDVQPAAMAWFGQPVARVKQISSYSCRNMNGARTGKISEHAYGNALDISGFVLADGREVMVKGGWKGQQDESGFLRTVQATACERFTTVLAPGSNIYHYDHIHVDLMRRSSGRVACNPAPIKPRPPMQAPMIYKAPPMASPMVSRPYGAAPVAEMQVDEQDVGYPEQAAPVMAAPAPVRAAPALSGAAAARQQRQLEQGRAMPVRTAPVYAAPAQGYPAPARAAPAPTYPTQSYPTQAYPAPAQEAGAPMVLSPNTAPSPYGHGVDPNYQSPAPAYPAQGYPTQPYPAQGYPPPQPAASPYPAQGYPAQAYPAPQPYPAQAPKPTRSLPPGVPRPPAGVPLAKWLGLDQTVTGSTGNVRSFTSEREFASPIKVPEAAVGED